MIGKLVKPSQVSHGVLLLKAVGSVDGYSGP